MLAESNIGATNTSILNGSMFEEPGPIAEERPDDETWDDGTTDEMLHGQDDSGPVDDGDNEAEEQGKASKKGHFIAPPSVEDAEKAFHNLGDILKPHCEKEYGFEDPGQDRIITEWLSGMKLLCYNYVEMQNKKPALS